MAIQVHRKKIQNDSDIFYVVMTSSFFGDDKNVGIVLNFFMRTFIVKMNNLANFYKNRNGGRLFYGNFLYYFILLGYGTMGEGVYYRTFRGHVTPYPQFFPSFFSPKVRKRNFHNISNRVLIEIQGKYEKNHLKKSAVVHPPPCPIPH